MLCKEVCRIPFRNLTLPSAVPSADNRRYGVRNSRFTSTDMRRRLHAATPQGNSGRGPNRARSWHTELLWQLSVRPTQIAVYLDSSFRYRPEG
jgi:hypothetical protein